VDHAAIFRDFFFRLRHFLLGWCLSGRLSQQRFYHLPQRPGRPPLAPPLGAPRWAAPLPAVCWPTLSGWPPRPPRGWPRWPRWLLEPRWFAGSCPDNHSGGGTGFGAGGGAGGAAFAAVEGLARTGITDSSLARFVAGSCGSLPPLMVLISLVAATLVAFEVRWTPSPAQMLVPSTVDSSCKGDSSGPNLSGNPDPGGSTREWCHHSRRP
jgi:hypothetical protein